MVSDSSPTTNAGKNGSSGHSRSIVYPTTEPARISIKVSAAAVSREVFNSFS